MEGDKRAECPMSLGHVRVIWYPTGHAIGSMTFKEHDCIGTPRLRFCFYPAEEKRQCVRADLSDGMGSIIHVGVGTGGAIHTRNPIHERMPVAARASSPEAEESNCPQKAAGKQDEEHVALPHERSVS